jgi:acetyl/propionyl-CoA carboxylase alpha subunit
MRIVAEDTKRGFVPWCGTITRFDYPDECWARLYSHVPRDMPYKIPTEYDPNFALAIIWGEDTQQAKERARQFQKGTVIEGKGVKEEGIITNMDYLYDRIDDVLQF